MPNPITAEMWMSQVIDFANEHFQDDNVVRETLKMLRLHESTEQFAESTELKAMLKWQRKDNNWVGFRKLLENLQVG